MGHPVVWYKLMKQQRFRHWHISLAYPGTVIFSFPQCSITSNVPLNGRLLQMFPQLLFSFPQCSITANVPPMVTFSQWQNMIPLMVCWHFLVDSMKPKLYALRRFHIIMPCSCEKAWVKVGFFNVAPELDAVLAEKCIKNRYSRTVAVQKVPVSLRPQENVSMPSVRSYPVTGRTLPLGDEIITKRFGGTFAVMEHWGNEKSNYGNI